jgi:stage III sporulation protein AB
MKTVGILLLFGLCTTIGMRLAARRTERYRHLCVLHSELNRFSETIGATQATLSDIAQTGEGDFYRMLQTYLSARNSGMREWEAANIATSESTLVDADRQAMVAFLNGLSSCSLSQLKNRAETLDASLAAAERDAEQSAKQAKTIRALGVLVGVGFCILLL